MSNTTSKGIQYPTSGDNIAPLETVFASLATTTNTALGAINAGTDIISGVLPLARGGTNHAGGSIPADADVAGKNVLLNGDFTIWQRGTSFTNPANGAYTTDRWINQHSESTASTRTISKQTFTLGSAPVAGLEYTNYFRYAISAIGTSNTYNAIMQKVEEVRTFANQTVTYSFWAKADSATGRTISLNVEQGLGRTNGATVTPSQVNTVVSGSWYKDGVFVSTGSSITLGTSFARYSVSFTVPSIAGKVLGTDTNSTYLAIRMEMAVGITMTYDFFGMQLESGSVLTNFAINSATPAAELFACQRFFYAFKSYGNVASAGMTKGTIGSASYFTTTQAYGILQFPNTMRAQPSASYPGLQTFITVFTGGSSRASLTAGVWGTGPNAATITFSTATAVAGQGGWMETNAVVGTILFEAELP